MNTSGHLSNFPQSDSYPRVQMTSECQRNPTGWPGIWMNTTVLKVLREIHLGLLITELDMRWNMRIRRGWPRTTKRVLSQSGFVLFECHGTVYPREREKERERERESRTHHKPEKERKDITYAWKMNEHVTCKI